MTNNFNKLLPRIVFVDGPTGVGKDYFIEKFTQTLQEKRPDLKFKTLRAIDFLFNDYTKTENRKYTPYQTQEDKCHQIYVGHIKLLCAINEIINLQNSSADIVIINRSLLSFIIYNLNPNICEFENKIEDEEYYKVLIDNKDNLISVYKKLFKNLFYNNFSLFIHLGMTEDDLSANLATICNRVINRAEGKAVDMAWIATLLNDYQKLDDNFKTIFTSYEMIDSDGYNYILNKYF